MGLAEWCRRTGTYPNTANTWAREGRFSVATGGLRAAQLAQRWRVEVPEGPGVAPRGSGGGGAVSLETAERRVRRLTAELQLALVEMQEALEAGR